jgi:ubiquinone/menaquinone biosynthesis C-methylase UbiE
MLPRPEHWTRERADRFADRTVVDRYHLRLPYPPGVFDTLEGLIVDTPRRMLDMGTGTGEIARVIAARVDAVDAVDASNRMIARGRAQPGGDFAGLRWIVGRAEDVPLDGPYALVTTGDSLHWMDWDVVLPRFGRLLTSNGVLAIVHREGRPSPWQDGLSELIATWSTVRNWQDIDLIAALEQRGLFQQTGTYESDPVTSRQSIDDYIESFHSRSSLSRESMAPEAAAAFDAGLRDLVLPWSEDGMLELQTVGSIEWGIPGGG